MQLATVGGKATASIPNGIETFVAPLGTSLIVPTSAVNASLTTLGKVSFNAQTSVSINGCFTSAYDNYIVITALTAASASTGVYYRNRVAGTDAITNYNINTFEINSAGTGASSNAAAQTLAQFGRAGISTGSGGTTTMTVFGPNLVLPTRMLSQYVDADFFGGTKYINHTTAAAYDGFTVLTNGAPTISGSIRIYGYNQG